MSHDNLEAVETCSWSSRIFLEKSSSGGRAKWFGEDGRLVALPDPILKRPTRPPNLDESDAPADPETFFCPPFFGVQSTNDEMKFSGNQSHCQLDVSSVPAQVHELDNYALNELMKIHKEKDPNNTIIAI